MIINNELICPNCGGELKYYDTVKRIIKGRRGKISWIRVRRFVCANCGKSHRELPNCLTPYKHYEIDIIRGVVNGTITFFDLDYEDYPCEATMVRWKLEFKAKS
jgi:uncharacterized Zn finger protein